MLNINIYLISAIYRKPPPPPTCEYIKTKVAIIFLEQFFLQRLADVFHL